MSVVEAIEQLKENGYEVERLATPSAEGQIAIVNGMTFTGPQLIDLATGRKTLRQIRQESQP